jgi:hypothetical protein
MPIEYVPKPDLETAKLFSDETRLKLLELLSKEELTNSQLSERLGLSKATITYHIKQLEDAGIITISRTEYEKHGIPMKYYKLKVHLVSMPSKEKTKRAYALKSEFKEKLGDLLGSGKEHLDTDVSKVLLHIMKAATAMPEEEVDGLLYSLGYELGKEVMGEKIQGKSLDRVVEGLAEYWRHTGLGEIEVVNRDDTLVLRIMECFDCVSMPNIGKTLCFFDAGIFAGTLEKNLKQKYSVREVKCWGTGYEYCEFEVTSSPT